TLAERSETLDKSSVYQEYYNRIKKKIDNRRIQTWGKLGKKDLENVLDMYKKVYTKGYYLILQFWADVAAIYYIGPKNYESLIKKVQILISSCENVNVLKCTAKYFANLLEQQIGTIILKVKKEWVNPSPVMSKSYYVEIYIYRPLQIILHNLLYLRIHLYSSEHETKYFFERRSWHHYPLYGEWSSNLEESQKIAKNNPEFHIEVKYKIAFYHKTYGKYQDALKIVKEISNDYKNIKMLIANCYKKIGDKEKIIEIIKDAIEKIASILKEIIEIIKDAIEKIVSILKEIIKITKDAIEKVVRVLKEIIEVIKNNIEAILNYLPICAKACVDVYNSLYNKTPDANRQDI
ncbi:29155_t:CDS:2, partial [Racocetra persica]